MKMLIFTRKNLLEMWHEPQIPLLQLILPLGMLIISWASYATPLLPTHTVLLEATPAAAAPVLQVLSNMTYPDGRVAFNLLPASNSNTAREAVQKHEADATLSLTADEHGRLNAAIFGDGTYMPFITASSLLESRLTPLLDQQKGLPDIVRLQIQPLYAGQMQTQFDPLAPGMLIFMIMLLGPQAAIYLGREARWGTLQRLRLAPLSAMQVLGGITLAQAVIGLLLTFLLLICMRLLNIHNTGSWLLSSVVCLLLSLSAVGMGLTAACFARNDFDAYNIASVFVMLQVFMSGAFFNMPPMTVFSLLGHKIGMFDFLPASHAMIILRQIFAGSATLPDIALRLVLMTLLSALYFAAGLVVFTRLKLK